MLSRIIGDSTPMFSSYARNASAADGADAAGVSHPPSSEKAFGSSPAPTAMLEMYRTVESVLRNSRSLSEVLTLRNTESASTSSSTVSNASGESIIRHRTRSRRKSSSLMYLGYVRCRSRSHIARRISVTTRESSICVSNCPITAFGTRVAG